MHSCSTCGYTTNRRNNLQTHYARKNKCQPTPENIVDIEPPVVIIVPEPVPEPTPEPTSEVVYDNPCQCKKCNKILGTKKYAKKHEFTCRGLHKLQCPTCLKMCKNKSAKSSHVFYGKCKPSIDAPESAQEELERLRKENEMLKTDSYVSTTTNNTNNSNNTTNNTTNIDKSTTTINIQYNNYDKPYTDHITNKVMKRIFETSQKDPSLILNETVRCIFKNDKHPENHVIKIGEKTALSKVFKDGKEIWLPMDGVIQTVLSNTGDFCADRLRDCHEEGDIEGTRVVVVWKLLEVLGTDDREVDCVNRASYIQSIKSAFL